MSHTPYSPSGAARYMQCPAAVPIAQKLGLEKEPHAVTIEGTCAHALAEMSFKTPVGQQPLSKMVGKHYGWFENKEYYECLITQDMVDDVFDYIQYCLKTAAHDGFTHNIHVEYSVASQRDGQRGSIDFWTLNRATKTLHLVDLKYGHTVVPVQNNKQLLTYAAWLLEEIGSDCIEHVCLHIYQPRASYIAQTTYTPLYIAGHAGVVTGCIAASKEVLERDHLDVDGDFVTGPACKYCPALTGCPAINNIIKGITDGK